LREALCRTLKSEGYLTSGAHSGAEALAALREAAMQRDVLTYQRKRY
jgi:hypothetical protein